MLVFLLFGVACAQEPDVDTATSTKHVEAKVEEIANKIDTQIEKMDEHLKEADELIRQLKEGIIESEKNSNAEMTCLMVSITEEERETCARLINDDEQAAIVIDDAALKALAVEMEPQVTVSAQRDSGDTSHSVSFD